MNTHKKAYIVLGAVAILALGAIQSMQLPASVITDCVGKTYGTAGCPLKTASSSSVSLTCGNGTVENGEECDNGKTRNGVTNCTTTCKLLYCGDESISPQLGEECEPDTEEVYVIDPETGQLTTEVHYLQPVCGTTCTVPTCDGDGNCMGGCKRKFMAACPVGGGSQQQTVVVSSSSSSAALSSLSVSSRASSASSVTPIVPATPSSAAVPSIPNTGTLGRCGDGTVGIGEQCDDGVSNSNFPGGRCRIDCTLARCGDSVTDTARGEQCDDGPNNSDLPNGRCRMNCTLPKCGDGTIDTARGEQCDDGPNNSNAANGHCRLDCALQRCGDGVVDQAEECDAGPANSDLPNARCSKSCNLPKCGDGLVQPGEQCDAGPNNSNEPNSHCRLNCALPKCGDGSIDTARGEQCDDGPNNSDLPGGHCSKTCQMPKCGDGAVQAGEECDDGNKNSDVRPNSCRTSCKAPTCGDSVLDADEQCDNGSKNGSEGNECSVSCEVLKPAASTFPGMSDGLSPVIPYAIGLAGFGSLLVIAFVFRKRLHGLVSKVAGEKIADSLDDIPLDEIEMPWHNWH